MQTVNQFNVYVCHTWDIKNISKKYFIEIWANDGNKRPKSLVCGNGHKLSDDYSLEHTMIYSELFPPLPTLASRPQYNDLFAVYVYR